VSSSTVTVTVNDATPAPVAGKTVTLAKNGGSSTITTVSGTTNASGVASFTVKDSSPETTIYTATDSTDSVVITQTATVTFTAQVGNATTSTVVASPTSVLADGATTSTITVTLKDADSAPVAGKTVTLAKNSGSSTITTVSGVTNAAGLASFSVKDSLPETTVYTATDVTDSNTAIAQTAAVTFTAAVNAGTSTVVANPTTVIADGVTASTITVTLKESNSAPVAGKTVTLSAGSGSSTISTVSGTTNAQGVATFTVKDNTAQAVTYTARDTTDSVAITQTATVTFTPNGPMVVSGTMDGNSAESRTVATAVGGVTCAGGGMTLPANTSAFGVTLAVSCGSNGQAVTFTVNGQPASLTTSTNATCLQFAPATAASNTTITPGGTPNSSCGR